LVIYFIIKTKMQGTTNQISNSVVAVQVQQSVRTHSPPPRCGFLVKKLTVLHLVMKFCAMCKIRSFSTTFTTAEFMPSHCVSWKYGLILSFRASLLFLTFFTVSFILIFLDYCDESYQRIIHPFGTNHVLLSL